MTGADLVLAAALLVVPPGVPEPPPPADCWPGLRAAVLQVAEDQELIDPREARYFFAKPEDFSEDVNTLRRRRAELADAPPLADAHRLPPREYLAEGRRFNREFQRHLERRAEWERDRAGVLLAAAAVAAHSGDVWDAAHDARCDYYYVPARRRDLQKLRLAVGEDAYRAGVLPGVLSGPCPEAQ